MLNIHTIPNGENNYDCNGSNIEPLSSSLEMLPEKYSYSLNIDFILEIFRMVGHLTNFLVYNKKYLQ